MCGKRSWKACKYLDKMLRCQNETDCPFYQECQPSETGEICPGNCVYSPWFISAIIWTIIGTSKTILKIILIIFENITFLVCIIVACFRCECCPLHKYLLQRGDIPVKNVPSLNPRRKISEHPRQFGIATFEEAVLVRSLSEHNK